MSHLLPSEKLEEQLPSCCPACSPSTRSTPRPSTCPRCAQCGLRASWLRPWWAVSLSEAVGRLESQAPGLTGPPSWHCSLLAPAPGWCPAGRLSLARWDGAGGERSDRPLLPAEPRPDPGGSRERGSRTLDVSLTLSLSLCTLRWAGGGFCEQAGARRCAPAMGVPAEGPRSKTQGGDPARWTSAGFPSHLGAARGGTLTSGAVGHRTALYKGRGGGGGNRAGGASVLPAGPRGSGLRQSKGATLAAEAGKGRPKESFCWRKGLRRLLSRDELEKL